jgi:UDPglucose 6-dehydrogenase
MFSYSIIGLGKLGASIGAAIASQGRDVIGVDLDRCVVDAINAGKAPVHETGLDNLVAANRARLRATNNYREALLNTDLTFVIVPTPSTESGAFSLKHVELSFGEIGKAMRDKKEYHLVALTSTVLPGSTRYALMPILERTSRKTCGPDFGLCYSPTFVALGSVIRDFLHPDFTLIGEFDEKAGLMLEAAYRDILPNPKTSTRMTLENAELAKISINTYVTMKITFANVLADLCERLPGGDVDAITAALGLDTRIGQKYLTGALGYGGPCFPRDNQAFEYMANVLGARAEFARTTDRLNALLPEVLLDRMGVELTPGIVVALLGLAYKPFSHVTEQSQGVLLARALSRRGVKVVAHDPMAEQFADGDLGCEGIALQSLTECLRDASVVIVVTPDPVYAELDADDFRASGNVTVIDCWRILGKRLSNKPKINYRPIGRSVNDAFNSAKLSEMWSSLDVKTP